MTTETNLKTEIVVDIDAPVVETSVTKRKKALTKRQCKSIYNKAHHAGVSASKKAKPTPMYVGTPTHVFGSDIDPTKPVYYVEGGVCGFAWVEIKPARGNFVKWLKENGHGYLSSYGHGYCVSALIYTQSLARNEAYARAFAEVLKEHGITCRMNSRLD